ncbi:MAG TPA: FAD-dependent oxidoreductase [Spirochaetia bacterium]|nr:FAD-dependent oxidoreductase [Spirochaetia bacterium]
MDFLIDGRMVTGRQGDSLLAAAREAGIYLPALCSHPALPPAGECGLCLVEVTGVAGPVKACQTSVVQGMEVRTDTPAVRDSRRENLKAILATHPHACLTCAQREGCSRTQCSSNVPVEERCCELLGSCELGQVADFLGIPADTPRYRAAGLVPVPEPLFLRRPELCVGCGRCVRSCADLRGVSALTLVNRGGTKRAGPAREDLAGSGCRLCGACVAVCPTGALTDVALATGEREAALVPCHWVCPAGVDVPAYVRAVANGDYDQAVRVLRESLALPGVLARVCFHPCEDVCRRGLVNQPVAICRLKRAAVAYGGANPPPPLAATGKLVAVVGAGPAGLAAADALVSLGHRVTVLEARSQPGGMLRWAIPAYRLPREVVHQEIAALEERGVTIKTGVAVADAAGLLVEYDAVFVATGAVKAQVLGLPGEDLAGVITGLDFLAAVAAGQPPVLRDPVVVIGGGHTAVDCARSAVRLGAQVTVLYRRTLEASPAGAEEWAQAAAEGVTFWPLAGPTAFGGQYQLENIECLKYGLVEGETGGRGRVVAARESMFTLAAGTAIVAVGQNPDPQAVGLSTRVADREGRTPVPGIFAGGDLVNGSSSVVEAIASGRQAALVIDRYLGGGGELPRLFDPPPMPGSLLSPVEGFWTLARPGFTGRFYKPQETGGCPAGDVLVSRFAEVAWPLTEEMAEEEAGRCLNCDLRLLIPAAPRPPAGVYPLTAAAVRDVPAGPGVYQLWDAEKNVQTIVGTDDLHNALEEVLAAGSAATYFTWEENPMYTQRESQLIARFVEEHGRMPGGAGDELDDLF